jgi:3-oxoacyl-(acyl-carrier-protein) synthase
MISVLGIGWLAKGSFGRVASKECVACGDDHDGLVKKRLFSYPVKNFGRFDRLAKMTCYGVALALSDAGIEYSATHKRDIGIIGTSSKGSLKTDLEYFRDYIEGGRTLSRGNLFIYTLPSSPLGEASIHFGFLGPMLYVNDGAGSLDSVLDTAGDMVAAGETPIMLAGKAEEEETVFFVLSAQAGLGRAPYCALSEARAIVRSNPDMGEMARKFSCLNERKA